MKISFYGAARSVTGSRHLIESEGRRILLDCGLFQGRRAEAFERNAHPPFDSKTIDTVLLSHAHIDHCGNLPSLVKNGFRGQINCTNATRDLVALMLRDSARIQEQDAEYLNQKKSRRGLPPIVPLYTSANVDQTLPLLTGRPYEAWFNLGNPINATAQFIDAGHILGSAITIIELHDQGRALRIGFSGDLGRYGNTLLHNPQPAPNLDYLVMESTYGNRDHPPGDHARKDLVRIVEETIAQGGKVIIPAFALERTQEVVYHLHLQNESGALVSVPTFVDSPLAIDATDVFRLHLECLRDDVHEHLLAHRDPFGFAKLEYTRSVDESKSINEVEGAAIIVSASGMVEAGRVLHHLKRNIQDERNTILFVGFQAEHTLGRRLLDGAKTARIFGDEYPVRARVEIAHGFSAHADCEELQQWFGGVKDTLKGVFIVHGEEQAALALADTVRGMGDFEVTVPELDQTIEI